MIKVLIVDDSAVVRNLLKEILSSDPHIEVVATAPDPFIARDKIIKHNPDVMTLDVEMPRMDGITFLRKVMHHFPIPVVMVSSLTQKGTDTALQALEEGAVDVIAKPQMDITKGISSIAENIVTRVKAASKAKVKRINVDYVKKVPSKAPLKATGSLKKTTHQIVAIGASTGGTEALREVLTRMPPDSPPILIVQHMPEKFTKAFAERLDSICSIQVREASDRDGVVPGTALIAPGNYHMELARSGARYYVKLNQNERVFHQRPSVNVLFKSVAHVSGANAVGVIMTGMGADGAGGLLEMRNEGAGTIGQDESSCIVYGMPKEAVKLGAVDRVVPLDKIPENILSMIKKKS